MLTGHTKRYTPQTWGLFRVMSSGIRRPFHTKTFPSCHGASVSRCSREVDEGNMRSSAVLAYRSMR